MIKKEMTPKEASAILEAFNQDEILDALCFTDEQRKRLNEALDIAIKALDPESCENKIIDEHYKKGFANGIRTVEWRYEKIKAEIDQEKYNFMANNRYDEGVRFGLRLAYRIIDKYKAESEK